MNVAKIAARAYGRVKTYLCSSIFKIEDNRPAILVVGVYLGAKKSHIGHIVKELGRSKVYRVEQRWAAIEKTFWSWNVASVTEFRSAKAPKNVLINRLVGNVDAHGYKYVAICDDDIKLPEKFVDNFFELQKKYDLALSQPARTPNSYIDHDIVTQVKNVQARQTRFVEIGPFVSMRHDIAKVLLPLDTRSPMGWGLDFVWPVQIEKHGLRMGIIDSVPVDHSLRAPVQHYDYTEARTAMENYLAQVEHLSPEDAFKVIEIYE